ncbi:MAG: hypothetical protein AVDCRST_MAG49-4271 [uncultured Thermomicrobiales bacterium]|uniref:Uncharacterized protein n=1 Tax=uncultured Thermomicrobiales bacterium TaxID=1645740 RepID=A0A6J4VGI6_9BACT|nr:MAG: hypothetical protein AVDCRST_MAG49-4271 [uncultured Thermomicrobiales bacterium]
MAARQHAAARPRGDRFRPSRQPSHRLRIRREACAMALPRPARGRPDRL